MFIDDNLSIDALFIFLSNMKALQNLMINCWYLINQFNKSLIYNENEQQLQICDEMLKSCIIWEIKKEIEKNDVRLKLLQIEVKNESVKVTLSKPVKTETIA